MSAGVEQRLLVGNGVELNVVIYGGEGETLLMLSGLGGGAARFGDLPARLARESGWRVVAVNPRGVAGSTGPMTGLTLHDFAAEVAGLIEQLGCAPAHVLGRAAGNRVARCLAADRPDLVRSLILLAAGGLAAPDPVAQEAHLRISRGEPMDREERLRLLKVAYFAARSDPSVWQDEKFWVEAAQAQLAANAATPLSDWWAGGIAPMLVIQGLEDAIAPVANGRSLKQQFGDRVTLVEIPHAGHALIVEQPDAVVRAIVTWLQE